MQVGDLRPYLCGFFDTTSGPKLEARSYRDIALSLGVDEAGEPIVKRYVFIDTAGIRKKGRVTKADDAVESLSVLSAMFAMTSNIAR